MTLLNILTSNMVNYMELQLFLGGPFVSIWKKKCTANFLVIRWTRRTAHMLLVFFFHRFSLSIWAAKRLTWDRDFALRFPFFKLLMTVKCECGIYCSWKWNDKIDPPDYRQILLQETFWPTATIHMFKLMTEKNESIDKHLAMEKEYERLRECAHSFGVKIEFYISRKKKPNTKTVKSVKSNAFGNFEPKIHILIEMVASVYFEISESKSRDRDKAGERMAFDADHRTSEWRWTFDVMCVHPSNRQSSVTN